MMKGWQKSRDGQVCRAARIQDRKLDKNSGWPKMWVVHAGKCDRKRPAHIRRGLYVKLRYF